MAARPLNRFYVYELVDPRNGEVFYVGKGSGQRRFQHEKDARKLRISVNARKSARILAILDAGLCVEPRVVRDGMTEREAFDLERQMIRAGRASLTNRAPGVRSHREWAKTLLSRYRPFDAWASELRPNDLAVEIYHSVKAELTRIANGSLDSLPPGTFCA